MFCLQVSFAAVVLAIAAHASPLEPVAYVYYSAGGGGGYGAPAAPILRAEPARAPEKEEEYIDYTVSVIAWFSVLYFRSQTFTGPGRKILLYLHSGLKLIFKTWKNWNLTTFKTSFWPIQTIE